MRLALVLGLALLASSARAASVDFTLALEPGTMNWELALTSVAPGISEIALEASQSLGQFQLDPWLPQPGNVIFVLFDQLMNGRNLLLLRASPGTLIVAGPTFFPVPIGTFSGSTALASLVELVGADDTVGYSVLDPAGVPLDYSITIVPEPALALLVGLGAALLGARRFRSNGI